LLQQQFGDRAPYRTDAARRAGDQNGICHVFSSCAFTYSKVRFLLSHSITTLPPKFITAIEMLSLCVHADIFNASHRGCSFL
jgi:hypothetical protein